MTVSNMRLQSNPNDDYFYCSDTMFIMNMAFIRDELGFIALMNQQLYNDEEDIFNRA